MKAYPIFFIAMGVLLIFAVLLLSEMFKPIDLISFLLYGITMVILVIGTIIAFIFGVGTYIDGNEI